MSTRTEVLCVAARLARRAVKPSYGLMRNTREALFGEAVEWSKASDSDESLDSSRCADGRSEMGLMGSWSSGRSISVLT
jgi:hypothetical protein